MSEPSLRALRLFELFFLPWFRRQVNDVLLTGLPRVLPAGPLLIVANHVSWWDGFVLREIHRLLRPHAPLRVVMTDRELSRNRILGRIAAVSIEPGSAMSVLRTFRALRRLRHARQDCVVLFFPQGRIWPAYRRPLGFEAGVVTLARCLAPVTVLPVALQVEPLAALRPTLFASAGAPIRVAPGERADLVALEAAVAARLDALLAFLAERGEAAPGDWPGPFGTLADASSDEVPPSVRTAGGAPPDAVPTLI